MINEIIGNGDTQLEEMNTLPEEPNQDAIDSDQDDDEDDEDDFECDIDRYVTFADKLDFADKIKNVSKEGLT